MRTVVFHMAGIESEQGNVLGVVGTFIDITRQREIQQALKESEARYRTLVETSPEAICVYQDSQIVFANAACLRLLGAADLRHAN
ncbi:MAG: PAS domain S-box protein, partial [Calditrichaeota bacterium]|nr:PAS domain S-box protein [Calditrichota bacterium]